jgi:hypothetical protein
VIQGVANMKRVPLASLTLTLALTVLVLANNARNAEPYVFERFPTSDTAQKAYDDADLNRAIEAYRFFGTRPRRTRG